MDTRACGRCGKCGKYPHKTKPPQHFPKIVVRQEGGTGVPSVARGGGCGKNHGARPTATSSLPSSSSDHRRLPGCQVRPCGPPGSQAARQPARLYISAEGSLGTADPVFVFVRGCRLSVAIYPPAVTVAVTVHRHRHRPSGTVTPSRSPTARRQPPEAAVWGAELLAPTQLQRGVKGKRSPPVGGGFPFPGKMKATYASLSLSLVGVASVENEGNVTFTFRLLER